jgi:hypothetical protein
MILRRQIKEEKIHLQLTVIVKETKFVLLFWDLFPAYVVLVLLVLL